MYSSFLRLLSNKPDQQLTRCVFQQNLPKILTYLSPSDSSNLKLTCRFLYYQFVTQEIWTGLKWGIAQEKMEFYDDYDFVEEEPKEVSKKDKNIRIHSLKKSIQGSKTREASNVKQKGKKMETINEINFRNTQIGFKRLLKTNTKKKILDAPSFNESQGLLQLPKGHTLNDFIINSKDPWSVNMHRSHKLITLVKKWNEFHHKFLTSMKKTQKNWKDFRKKIQGKQQDTKIYQEKFSTQVYRGIVGFLQGAKQNLLIDEQLNKVGKLFWSFHIPMIKIASQIKSVVLAIEEEEKRMNFFFQDKIDSASFLQIFAKIDESIENMLNLSQKCPEVMKTICPTVVQLYFSFLQTCEGVFVQLTESQSTSLHSINWKHLCIKPEFYEFLFQVLAGLCTKLLKLVGGFCKGDLTINMTANKIDNTRAIGQILWNIAKYFSKLRKQVEAKEKKGKDTKLKLILNFMNSYENKPGQQLFDTKNVAKMEKIMGEFKEQISVLKGNMQSM